MDIIPAQFEMDGMIESVVATLNASCVILAERQDADGQGGTRKSWSAIGSEACRFVPVKAQKVTSNGTTYEPIGDLEMLVRKDAPITTANRIQGDGRTWAVLSVTPRHTHARIILGGTL